MPFSPSDFAWWMWLLFALGAGIVFGITYGIASFCWEKDSVIGFAFFGLLVLAAGLGALGCFLMGVVRFAKWAWSG